MTVHAHLSEIEQVARHLIRERTTGPAARERSHGRATYPTRPWRRRQRPDLG